MTAIVIGIDGGGSKTTALVALEQSTVRFRVDVKDGGLCAFSFALQNGNFVTVPTSCQAREGLWIGARVGLYACCPSPTAAYADFDYFRFLPHPRQTQP